MGKMADNQKDKISKKNKLNGKQVKISGKKKEKDIFSKIETEIEQVEDDIKTSSLIIQGDIKNSTNQIQGDIANSTNKIQGDISNSTNKILLSATDNFRDINTNIEKMETNLISFNSERFDEVEKNSNDNNKEILEGIIRNEENIVNSILELKKSNIQFFTNNVELFNGLARTNKDKHGNTLDMVKKTKDLIEEKNLENKEGHKSTKKMIENNNNLTKELIENALNENKQYFENENKKNIEI